jgi:hypothetical protein
MKESCRSIMKIENLPRAALTHELRCLFIVVAAAVDLDFVIGICTG